MVNSLTEFQGFDSANWRLLVKNKSIDSVASSSVPESKHLHGEASSLERVAYTSNSSESKYLLGLNCLQPSKFDLKCYLLCLHVILSTAMWNSRR